MKQCAQCSRVLEMYSNLSFQLQNFSDVYQCCECLKLQIDKSHWINVGKSKVFIESLIPLWMREMYNSHNFFLLPFQLVNTVHFSYIVFVGVVILLVRFAIIFAYLIEVIISSWIVTLKFMPTFISTYINIYTMHISIASIRFT